MGDPHERELFVYLPPAYDPAQRYPLVLMLPSHGNTAQSLLNWRGWGEGVDQQADRLILSGACPPFVMVLPDTWTALGGSLHLNSPLLGNYETYLLEEILPFVEGRYPLLPDRRAVMGRSSGGYAALVFAMRRRGLFQAVAAHSADLYFEFSLLPEFAKMDRLLAGFNGLEGFLNEARALTPKQQAFFDLAAPIAALSVLAQNPAAPFGFDLPIDDLGALREDVWERCLPYDPLRMVVTPTHAESLRELRALVIDCGAYDEYNLQVGARLFHRTLDRLGIRHIYESYPAGHRHTQYRYDVSLPILVRALLES